MCLLCAELAKQNMTTSEVAQAMMEISVEDDHFQAIADTISDNYDLAEVEQHMLKILNK